MVNVQRRRLFLEQLMPHSEEGDGQAAAEEQDELDCHVEPAY